MDIVDAIRSTLRNNIHDREIIIDFAAEYAEECAALNQRLREISDLLRKGKRAEAILICEREPNALELFSALDFLELDSWIDLLTDLELESPPILLADLAAEIDEAYNDEEKLEPLLRQHRILALRNGYLNQRINVLRKIVGVSSENALWLQDLQSYEKVRLKEINQEANQAVNTGDKNSLKGLVAELSQEWTIPVPERLQTSVQNAFVAIEKKEAQARIKKLNAQLNAALSEYDIEKATKLRGKWEQTAPQARLSEDHELRTEVEEVFQWLDEEETAKQEEQEFKHTLAEIETKIFQRDPFDEVEQLYYLAERYERDIPVVLQNQFLNYRTTYEIGRKRKFVTILSLSSLGVIILAMGIYFFFDAIHFSTKKSNTIQELKIAIEAEDWVIVGKFVDNLDERLLKEPEIQRLVSNASEQIEAEKKRLSNFKVIMSKLKEAPKDPPPNDLISQAQTLAKTDSEKQSVEVLRISVENFQQKLLVERNQKFQTQMDAWINDLTSFEAEKNPSRREDSLRTLRNTLIKSIKENEGNYHGKPLVSDSFLKRVDDLVERCESSLSTAMSDTAYDADLMALKSTAANKSNRLSEYSQKVEWFINKYPDEPDTFFLKKNAKEFDLLIGWNNWSSFLRQPEWARLKVMNKAQADLLIAQYQQLRLDHRANEPTANIKKGIDFLNLVKDVDVQMELMPVKEFLQGYAFNELWIIERNVSGRTEKFYVPANPNVDGNIARKQKYYTNFPRNENDLNSQKTNDLANIVDSYPAPHNALTKSLVRSISRFQKSTTIETAVLNLCNTCLDAEKDVDVIIKGMFLHQIIASSFKSSKNLELLLKPEFDDLSKLKLESANWLWEKTKNLNSLRSSTAAVIEEIRDKIKNVDFEKKSAEQANEARPEPTPTLEWQGAVFKSADGDWILQPRDRSLPNCQLYGIEEKNGEAVVISLGSWDANLKKASFDDVSAISIGRIVVTMNLED